MTDSVSRSLSRPVAGVLVGAGLCAAAAVLLGTGSVRLGVVAQPVDDIVALAVAAVGAGSAMSAAVASRLLGEPRLAWIAAALLLYGALVLPWARSTAADLTTIVLLAGAIVAVVAFAVEGARRRGLPWLRLGLGVVVLALAQLSRIAGPDATDLATAGLRLLGLGVVLAGLAHVVARAVADLRSESWLQQEELVVAALHRERAGELAAERDHELRNGLAGLAGITHLIGAHDRDAPDHRGADHERLKHAVLAELGRLHRILDGGELEPETAAAEYAVGPVLEGLVALRSGAARPVVEPGLYARGDPAVLAQVVTNLLANCERHAPGAAVAVRAGRRGTDVVIEVRDRGPGLPSGVDPAVALDRGVRDEAAGGSGLGLYISRRLIGHEGGSLRLTSVYDPPGCLVTVTVPGVGAPLGVTVGR